MRLTAKVGTWDATVKPLSAGDRKRVIVDPHNRLIGATPDATISDLLDALDLAEKSELAGAWPPPELVPLTEP